MEGRGRCRERGKSVIERDEDREKVREKLERPVPKEEEWERGREKDMERQREARGGRTQWSQTSEDSSPSEELSFPSPAAGLVVVTYIASSSSSLLLSSAGGGGTFFCCLTALALALGGSGDKNTV